MWVYVLIFIGAALLLARSGAWVVQILSRIARFLKWSEFMVAFILMAFISSFPEMFVGISSVIHGIPEVSFGNIIGANVINLTLAVGLAVIFLGGLNVGRKVVKSDSIFMVFSALLPLILILDKTLSRVDGVILLLSFVIYISWLFSKKERFHKIYNDANWGLGQFLKDIVIFLGSVGLLFASAELIIWSARAFAAAMGISTVVVGVLLISSGTALPETYFVVKAAMRGKKEMILGNLMGCVVITSLLVLGIVALLSPIKIADFSPYFAARAFLLVSAIFFLLAVRTGEKITKKEALLLILVYLAFVVAEILLK